MITRIKIHSNNNKYALNKAQKSLCLSKLICVRAG